MKTNFHNANDAFNYFYIKIKSDGVDFGDTKALFNIGFTMSNPLDNIITNEERNFNIDYAEAEWKWYLSGDNILISLASYTAKFLLYGNACL